MECIKNSAKMLQGMLKLDKAAQTSKAGDR